MNYIKTIVIFVVLFLAGTSSLAQKIAWGKMYAKNTKDTKPSLVYCYTKWCNPCKIVDRTYFSDPKIIQQIQANYQPVKIDMDNGELKKSISGFNVKLYPSFLILDNKGNLIDRFSGYPTQTQFVNLLERGRSNTNNMSALLMKYENQTASMSELQTLSEILLNAGDPMTEEVAQKYLNSVNDWSSEEVVKYIFRYGKANYGSPLFQYMLRNEAHFRSCIGDAEYEEKVDYAAYSDMSQKLKNSRSLVKLGSHYKRYYKDEQKALNKAMRKYLVLIMYSDRKEDKAAFMTTIQDFLQDEPDYDWKFYNAVAWETQKMTDDPALLRKCSRWADISIKKEPNYYNLDTKAVIENKLGNRQKALKYIKKAIQVGSISGLDVEESIQLKKIIEGR